MSRYSSNSDDDSYRSKKARRKRHRSVNCLRVSHNLIFVITSHRISPKFIDPNRIHLMIVIEKDEMTDGIDDLAAEVEIGSYYMFLYIKNTTSKFYLLHFTEVADNHRNLRINVIQLK